MEEVLHYAKPIEKKSVLALAWLSASIFLAPPSYAWQCNSKCKPWQPDCYAWKEFNFNKCHNTGATMNDPQPTQEDLYRQEMIRRQQLEYQQRQDQIRQENIRRQQELQRQLEQERQRQLLLQQNPYECVTVDSRSGWQRFTLSRAFNTIQSISGGWSVDGQRYARVGASGHFGSDAQALSPYNQYK
jgi:hypothetical protein